MPPTSNSLLSPRDVAESSATDSATLQRRIAQDFERLLGEARPRLLRLAQLHGVPLFAADDVVQEVLLEAWRSLEHLREPGRFDAWLDGICRNVSRRHLRAESGAARRIESLATGFGTPNSDDGLLDLPDPKTPDLDEALSRQDLLTLIDRGIGYLPQRSREALWLHYIDEAPSKEAARRLGVSPGAFDVRLHRARQQLREVLSTRLRAEAESFGLIVDTHDEGWRETRLWCLVCGRRKMQGRFAPRSNGGFQFYLRCPDCYERYDAFHVNTPIAGPEAPRSFGPAFKRTLRNAALYYSATAAHPAQGPQPCIGCGKPGPTVRVVHSDDVPAPTLPGHRYFFTRCPFCGLCFSSISVAIWLHPEVQRFAARYSRWIAPAEEPTEYAGTAAYHFRLIDLPSQAQLHVFADATTLQVFNTFED